MQTDDPDHFRGSGSNPVLPRFSVFCRTKANALPAYNAPITPSNRNRASRPRTQPRRTPPPTSSQTGTSRSRRPSSRPAKSSHRCSSRWWRTWSPQACSRWHALRSVWGWTRMRSPKCRSSWSSCARSVDSEFRPSSFWFSRILLLDCEPCLRSASGVRLSGCSFLGFGLIIRVRFGTWPSVVGSPKRVARSPFRVREAGGRVRPSRTRWRASPCEVPML